MSTPTQKKKILTLITDKKIGARFQAAPNILKSCGVLSAVDAKTLAFRCVPGIALPLQALELGTEFLFSPGGPVRSQLNPVFLFVCPQNCWGGGFWWFFFHCSHHNWRGLSVEHALKRNFVPFNPKKPPPPPLPPPTPPNSVPSFYPFSFYFFPPFTLRGSKVFCFFFFFLGKTSP